MPALRRRDTSYVSETISEGYSTRLTLTALRILSVSAGVFLGVSAVCADSTVATFAGRRITSDQVSRRIAIAACYPGPALTPGQAAFQLLELAASERILQRLNLQISLSLVEAEAQRIDKETQAPDILAAIKKACGTRADYLAGYVKPIVIQRLVQKTITWSPKIQEEARRKAEVVLRRAVTLDRLPDAAKAAGLTCTEFIISDEPPARVGAASSPPVVPTSAVDPPLRQAVLAAKPGRLIQQVVEGQTAFYVAGVKIRVDEADDGEAVELRTPVGVGEASTPPAVVVVPVMKATLEQWATTLLSGDTGLWEDAGVRASAPDAKTHWLTGLLR